MIYIRLLFTLIVLLLGTYYVTCIVAMYKNPYFSDMKWIIPFYNWFHKKF